ncbi:MAG: HNH endonuclease [Xanthomonadaceae bacterium]|jgi:hypothetical protein|nr:HNH endonuclease [Xanthomonadaceae bacterium]
MSETPGDAVPETIPGNPNLRDANDAQREFQSIADRGGGQPYLIAVKIVGEPRVLHLRAYLDGASDAFTWASIELVPPQVRDLVKRTTQRRATNWSQFESAGVAPSAQVQEVVARLSAQTDHVAVIESLNADVRQSLLDYLRYPGAGLFFDPAKNHDAWIAPTPLPMVVLASIEDLIYLLAQRLPTSSQGDAAADEPAVYSVQVDGFREQIEQEDYSVADAKVTTNSRGSAQQAFAEAVKANYDYACAITGVKTRAFLVASHIVPWSVDQSIRLDPSNGVCLSLMADRAFEKGYLTIDDDLTVRIDKKRIGEDLALLRLLLPLDGSTVRTPKRQAPRVEYLRRRRALVVE